MESKSIIVNRSALAEAVFSHIHSEEIRLVEKNGSVTLTPVFDKYAILEKSFGMFADGRLTGGKEAGQ